MQAELRTTEPSKDMSAKQCAIPNLTARRESLAQMWWARAFESDILGSYVWLIHRGRWRKIWCLLEVMVGTQMGWVFCGSRQDMAGLVGARCSLLCSWYSIRDVRMVGLIYTIQWSLAETKGCPNGILNLGMKDILRIREAGKRKIMYEYSYKYGNIT